MKSYFSTPKEAKDKTQDLVDVATWVPGDGYFEQEVALDYEGCRLGAIYKTYDSQFRPCFYSSVLQ